MRETVLAGKVDELILRVALASHKDSSKKTDTS